MKIIQKLLLILFSMIMGVVLLLGGGALYVYLNASKPGSLQGVQKLIPDSVPIEWDNELLNMSILDYLKFSMSTFANAGEARIGDFERVAGTDFISSLLEANTGIDKQLYKASTLNDFSKTVTENLTLANLKDNFGFELGEFPLFHDEGFLSTPINMAFASMTDYNLDLFVQVTYDDDATEDNPASRPLLQKLGKMPVSALSANLDDTINKSKINELVTVDDDSSQILKSLSESTVEDLDQSIKDLVLKEMITIDENSHIVMKKFGELTVDELSDSEITKGLIDEIKLSEFIEIDENSPKLLQSLADTEIENLGAKVDELTVAEIFENTDQGALSMIDSDTKLADIPSEIGGAIPNTSLYHLKTAGVFEVSDPGDTFGKVKVYNATMQDAITQFSEAIATPEGQSVIFKRNIIYLYDDMPLYENEKTDDDPYNEGITNFLYTYHDPINNNAILSMYMEVVEIDISGVEQNSDGFYIITDDLLSTMINGDRVKNGTEVVLQRGVNVIFEGDDSSPDNTYNSIVSVSSYYEDSAVLQSVPFVAIDQFDPINDIGTGHGIIRIGNNIKIKNRIGGYIYIRGPEGSVQTDIDENGIFENFSVYPTVSVYPTIEFTEIWNQNSDPSVDDSEPNILFEILIDE